MFLCKSSEAVCKKRRGKYFLANYKSATFNFFFFLLFGCCCFFPHEYFTLGDVLNIN